jgi:hypothetical protein
MLGRLIEKFRAGDSPRAVARGLHDAALAAALDPVWYRDYGVADSVDGRFDMLCVMLWLGGRRLQAMERPDAPTQAFMAAVVDGFDTGLREAGESDQTVGRKVQSMTGALFGRMGAYEEALRAAYRAAALAEALARNVWRGEPPDAAQPAALARADVGIAMGAAGSDVALQAADVALLSENMERLAAAHLLAKRTGRIIRQNLVFAMGAMLVLVTGSLFFNLPLPLAVVGHEGGTVLVVLNGLRLLFDPIRSDRA